MKKIYQHIPHEKTIIILLTQDLDEQQISSFFSSTHGNN